MKILDDLAEGIVKTDKEMTERYNTNRKIRWYYYSIILLLLNIFVPILLLLYVMAEEMLTANFMELLYTTYSAAALVSAVLFLDIYITYENYKHRMPYNKVYPMSRTTWTFYLELREAI